MSFINVLDVVSMSVVYDDWPGLCLYDGVCRLWAELVKREGSTLRSDSVLENDGSSSDGGKKAEESEEKAARASEDRKAGDSQRDCCSMEVSITAAAHRQTWISVK